jgi:LysR family transcriptional regulator of gallate degradation
MDLRQLRNLIAVIEKGSLGKAAEALHVSQPALTKSIQRLEERLGVPLFYRDSRGMRPTIYGQAFRAHAQAVSLGVDQALLELEALKAGSVGAVKVAAPPLVTSQVLAKAALRLMQQCPGLLINITTEIRDATDDLLAGKYDFILTLLTGDAAGGGLRQKRLFDDRISMIVRRDHPLLKAKAVRARDLQNFQWILPLAGHFHRRKLESFFESQGLPPPTAALECSSTALIVSLVRSTDHVGLIAQMGLKEVPAGSSVAEIPINSPIMVRPIGMVWRENHVPSKSSQLFIEAIVATAAQLQSVPSFGRKSGNTAGLGKSDKSKPPARKSGVMT